MSRIGKQEIAIPQGVTVSVADGLLKVQGPKDTLERKIVEPVTVIVADGFATVDVPDKED